jgi:hypothetical protein
LTYVVLPYTVSTHDEKTKMPCAEKLRLLVEYQQKTQAYADAIGKMTLTNLSQSEAARLSAATEKARCASKDARARLDQHTADHGC